MNAHGHPPPEDAPLEARVPPDAAGIPPHLGWDADVPFWRPSPRDWLRYLGWRNLLFVPAGALVAGVAMAIVLRPSALWLIFQTLGFTGTATVLALPVVLAGYGIALAIRARKDPFCIHCGQCLYGLPPVHQCPECGRPYDLVVVEEYRRDPHWFTERWRQRRQLPRPEASVPVGAGGKRRRRTRDGT